MAKEKQDWKDSLRSAQQEGDRQDDRDNTREKKVKSRIMYQKRKLDKDVRKYTNNANPINSRAIGRIGRSHGFHVTGTLHREN